MKTFPSPPGSSHDAQGKAPKAFGDLRPLADFDYEEAPAIKSEPKGVLPWIHDPPVYPSMSLGTRRLCNDQPPPVLGTRYDTVISDAYGGTPVACIEWRRITFYREPARSARPAQPSLFAQQNLTRGSFNGYMSPATRRKVRRSVSTWIRSIFLYRAEVKRKYDPGRAYPVFLTVTLPTKQEHSDAEINRACLQPFLQQLRREYGIENYFWRAEAQDNGNVHFHILVDRYIPKKALQLAWNCRIDALGYLERYYMQSGSLFPPTTEVHAIKETVTDKKTGEVRHVDPVDYLIEYVMDTPTPEKDPGEKIEGEEKPRKLIGRRRKSNGTVEEYETRPITGRVWGMSDTLREIREPRAEATPRLIYALEAAREAGTIRRVDTDHATMYFGNVSVAIGRAHPGMWQLVKEHYLQVFGHLYPGQLPQDHVKKYPPRDPRNLWLDLEEFGLWNRLKLEEESPVFKSAQDLEEWAAQQAARQARNNVA